MTRSNSQSSHEPRWEWAELFAEHHAVFFSYALLFEPQVHDAEDLVQAALLRLAQGGRADCDAVAYAMAAIRNLAIDRRRQRRPHRSGGSIEGKPPTSACVDGRHRDKGTETVVDEDDAANLRAAFDALDQGRREVVILKVFGDLTLRQIAAVLNQPLGTVASTYRRAMIEIKTRLESECQHHERIPANRKR